MACFRGRAETEAEKEKEKENKMRRLSAGVKEDIALGNTEPTRLKRKRKKIYIRR